MSEQMSDSEREGLLLCARYAFMPNQLGYCGGKTHPELFQQTVNHVADSALRAILTQFHDLSAYIGLIAQHHDIADPFDYRVAEAYFIGNALTDGVEMRNLHQRLLPKKTTQLTPGAFPHHSFHVLNICLNEELPLTPEVVAGLNQCLIQPGLIIRILDTHMEVECTDLSFANDRLQLTSTVKKIVVWQLDGQHVIADPQVGQTVAIHWGFVCDILTDEQTMQLRHYTNLALALANS